MPPYEVTAATSPFLGEADFAGQPVRAAVPVSEGGQTTYNGLISFTNVARDKVADLLPPLFQLAGRTTASVPDVHPIVLLFGDQTDGASLVGGQQMPNGIHYSEMILAIPFVQRVGESNWHTHIVRMYLDNDLAYAAGGFFGYQKEKAWLQWTGDIIRVSSAMTNDLLLEGRFQWGTPWYDSAAAATNIANFSDIVSIMTTRLLGITNGIPICSHFEWNFDEAMVAETEGAYSMIQPFRNDMNTWPTLSPFLSATGGAIVVRGLRWRLAAQPHPLCW